MITTIDWFNVCSLLHIENNDINKYKKHASLFSKLHFLLLYMAIKTYVVENFVNFSLVFFVFEGM